MTSADIGRASECSVVPLNRLPIFDSISTIAKGASLIFINQWRAGYVTEIVFFISEARMPWGQRKADRVQFQHEHLVNLMAVDGTWRRACILKDVSNSGARLQVDGSTDVLTSKEFFLILSSTGLAFRRCQLVWINGPTVGVHFVFDKKKSKAPQ